MMVSDKEEEATGTGEVVPKLNDTGMILELTMMVSDKEEEAPGTGEVPKLNDIGLLLLLELTMLVSDKEEEEPTTGVVPKLNDIGVLLLLELTKLVPDKEEEEPTIGVGPKLNTFAVIVSGLEKGTPLFAKTKPLIEFPTPMDEHECDVLLSFVPLSSLTTPWSFTFTFELV
ncbi:hypothetical protein PanWU01x14_052180 [Parasponia andersonii]|uniref:Uncharacterized protein n=1 Tax=Parasponia andersonii TaxID=3476 RepID=A0A2P5DM73_PARAD|nr:hypothetical protein PanWU01x14_052180 [Parasponia andersonii]